MEIAVMSDGPTVIRKLLALSMCLAVGTAFAATEIVFDDPSPRIPAWTYTIEGKGLQVEQGAVDEESALCISNPSNAVGFAWSVVSQKFSVRPECDLEIALRLITPAAECGGGTGRVFRTGIVWLDGADRELGFRTMDFPSRESHLRTHLRRFGVPKGASAARISLGYYYSKFPADARFALSSARARLVGRNEAGLSDENFEETDVPRLELVSGSPCEKPRAPIRLRLSSRHPVDMDSLMCTVDGSQMPDRIGKRDGNIVIHPPSDGWPMPSFPKVRVSGRDARGTRFEDEQTVCFGSRMKKNLCTVRDDGVILVDGQPFFPIGLYGVAERQNGHEDDVYASFAEPMRRLKEAGCNVVQTYHNGTGNIIDLFLACADWYGLKAFIAPGSFCGDDDLAETVYRLRNHPSLLSWYIGDDSATHISARHLRRLHDCVHAVDNAHLTSQSDSIVWGDLSKSRFSRFVNCTDIYIPQFYPMMHADVTGREVPEIQRDLSFYEKDVRAAGNPKICLWSALQGFKGFNSWPRHPTLAEQRALTWLSVAKGARGVVWFIYNDQTKGNFGVVNDPDIWNSFTNVVSELNAVKGDLVSRDAKDQPTIDIVEGDAKDELGFPAITALLKEGAEERLLIAVNSSSHAVKARMRVKGVSAARTVFGNRRPAEVSDDCICETFDPLGVRIYRLNR